MIMKLPVLKFARAKIRDQPCQLARSKTYVRFFEGKASMKDNLSGTKGADEEMSFLSCAGNAAVAPGTRSDGVPSSDESAGSAVEAMIRISRRFFLAQDAKP
jgi:hypothetical protein